MRVFQIDKAKIPINVSAEELMEAIREQYGNKSYSPQEIQNAGQIESDPVKELSQIDVPQIKQREPEILQLFFHPHGPPSRGASTTCCQQHTSC